MDIIGIDEVGRGSIAGPLVVGFVVLKKKLPADLVLKIDSKKMSHKTRLFWFDKINKAKKDNYLDWWIVKTSSSIVDKKGLSLCLKKSIDKGLSKVDHNRVFVKLDGSLFAPKIFKQQTIIKGDEKETVIAMASVMAKVSRDLYMISQDNKYIGYNFAKHKGYGTKSHYQAIKDLGICPLHRKTFL